MSERVRFVVSKRMIFITLYILVALGASFQSLLLEPKPNPENGITYTNYNNYIIFKKSFQHLQDHQDLYVLYGDEHWDLYKYTPSFSVLFAVFTVLPDGLGLNLWNLLNALLLLWAVYSLPGLRQDQKGWILLVVLLELVGSLMNEQSNGIVAGLLVGAFALMEKKQGLWASLLIVLSMFIKLFGVVGFAFFLLYPRKWKLALYSLGWSLVILLLPLIFIDLDHYLFLMDSYGHMLANDALLSNGFSVLGWLKSWFSLEPDGLVLVLLGAGIFLVPLTRFRAYGHPDYRYLLLSSTLIWVIIFNHKAESATYVIAMTGVALWFIRGEKNWPNILLFSLSLLFTSLASTDLFPRELRESFVQVYAMKAVPCILIWLKIVFDMMTVSPQKSENAKL